MKQLLSIMILLLCPLTTNAGNITLPIEVTDAYAYATTSVQKNGAVFMQITNNTPQSDKITAASADVSDKVELHTHIMDGAMVQMREVEHYDLPPEQTTTLEPAGHHIMLIGLHEPLKAGERFPLTITLEQYGSITIDVHIKNPGDVE